MEAHVVTKLSKTWSIEYRISEKTGNGYFAFCHEGEFISMVTSADRTACKLAMQEYVKEHENK